MPETSGRHAAVLLPPSRVGSFVASQSVADPEVRGQSTPSSRLRPGAPAAIAFCPAENRAGAATEVPISGAVKPRLDILIIRRLAEVQRRLTLLDDVQVEVEWVATCLTEFDRVWDALSAENRSRLVRAIVTRVEVDEPNGDVRVFLADLGPTPDAEVLAAGVAR